MNRFALVGIILSATAILVRVTDAQKASDSPVDTLEGVLRVHPKFHYRYFIDGFGDGQECALFSADQRLQQIKLGSLLRVRGNLASKFFGQKDKTSALVSTWIIYMEVDRVEVLRGPVTRAQLPSESFPPPSATSEEGALKDTRQTLIADMNVESAPAAAWTGKLVTGETSGAVAAGKPQPKAEEARSLFRKANPVAPSGRGSGRQRR